MTCTVCNKLPCVCGLNLWQRTIRRTSWKLRHFKMPHRKHPKFMPGNAVAKDICKILGEEPDKVSMVTIHMEVGDVAKVYITRFLTKQENGKILAKFSEYSITHAGDLVKEISPAPTAKKE